MYGGQAEALSPGSGSLASDTFHPRRDPAASLSSAPPWCVIEPGPQERTQTDSSSGALRSRGHGNKMLLLFTEAGQLTFPEQKYSWEPGVGNLEGKREGCKGRNAENKCFFLLRSLRNGRALISCLQAWRKLRTREDGRVSHPVNWNLSLSHAKPVFSHRSEIISFLLRERGSSEYN